jgi:hypothetical protein
MGGVDELLLPSRCSRSKEAYRMRALPELGRRTWMIDYAYRIREDFVVGQQTSNQNIAGSLALSADFSGCPYCHARSFVKCNCGRFGCWSGQSTEYQCPWCGYSGPVGPSGINSFSGGRGQ